MVSINYSSREVCCKIVYYGPGLSGKTTNLQYVHSKVPGNTRGELISLATEADRTLYFDFLPINIGTINGFAAKFQLYTVPGQVYYNATRKLVLRGVDGVVFVADSQADKLDENIESLLNLEENLKEYGYDLDELPMVLQYNKRDLPGVMSVEELNARLNPRKCPTFEASATIGNGVFDTLKLIIKLVLSKAKTAGSGRSRSVTATKPVEPVAVEATEAEAVRTPVEASAEAVAGDRQIPSEPPVAVASGETAAETQTAAATTSTNDPVGATEPPPAVVVEPTSENDQYRPYPGDRGTGSIPRKISHSQFAPAPKPQSEGEEIEKNVIKTGEAVSQGDLKSPSMAPSLRRKGSGKKRGFFKRLFGIK